ncbi:MAG: DNA mismatch repair protein MutS [Candidatus Omnitrophica bacterium]|nr:DNA mismatch repair protein MutS [Candidatus Omnitrophota bacterium]
MTSEITPMMQQYMDIKAQQEDAILFFRLGDFYEMFYDDALAASKILHITLTSRNAGKGKKAPMCGVPHHAAENYIARLVRHGRKVAICEQAEEPGPGKKLVNRQITKVITPGTFIADSLLEDSVNNYILSLNMSQDGCGLAYADISTGEFRVTELDNKEDLFAELYKISPSECLVPESCAKDRGFRQISDINLGSITINDDWAFDYQIALKHIKDHFLVESLEGFGCEGLPLAVGAAGALIKYLKDTQKSDLKNIDVISTYRSNQFMFLDRNSHRHLELVQNQEDLTTRNTLFDVLDQTKTPMGKRKLKRAILNPLVEVAKINERLQAVLYFHENSNKPKKLRESLNEIYDIERLSNKISLATANARDMVALSASLKHISTIRNELKDAGCARIEKILQGMDELADVTGLIDRSISEEPPANIRDGGIIRTGYNEDVDQLRHLVTHGKDWVAALQQKEIETTGISSLKVGYNKVFGYYIEVTKANLNNVPEHYVRKQTLSNAERFITQELKDQESKIIGAEERIRSLEYEIFSGVRAQVGNQIDRLKKTSENIAELDMLVSFAEVASRGGYTKPKVDNSDRLYVEQGRHPVLENILKDKQFVPNDTLMDDGENRVFIITGSNMAGKSTYIRQVALITIMAQIGSFVPAAKAHIGVIDRIFTRVGASDRLYRGMSTFMVEMLETANILNNATGKSLIILDEIGRGTSTFDGVSIAWAVVEFIHHNLCGAKAMFATHYHELTELAQVMKGVRNCHLAVQQWADEIVFLYKVSEGSCDESFGIHVAKLAGLPTEVIQRARDILDNLQKDSLRGNIRSRFAEVDSGEKQFDFFEQKYAEHPLLEKMRSMDIENMTPIEALRTLHNMKQQVEKDK